MANPNLERHSHTAIESSTVTVLKWVHKLKYCSLVLSEWVLRLKCKKYKAGQMARDIERRRYFAKLILYSSVVTESVRNGLMSELLYADDLVLMSETMEGLREKFWKWKKAFESKRLKVNLGKTKVVVSGEEGEVSVSKVDPCGICGKRVMANSVLCVKCEM